MPEVRHDRNELIVGNAAYPWREITDIAFVTASCGSHTDGPFLVFRSRTNNDITVSLEWPGAGDLLGMIAMLDEWESRNWLFDNWTTDRNIVVWPLKSASGVPDLPAAVDHAMSSAAEASRLSLSDVPDPKEFADRLAKHMVTDAERRTALVLIVPFLAAMLVAVLVLAVIGLFQSTG